MHTRYEPTSPDQDLKRLMHDASQGLPVKGMKPTWEANRPTILVSRNADKVGGACHIRLHAKCKTTHLARTYIPTGSVHVWHQLLAFTQSTHVDLCCAPEFSFGLLLLPLF
jgi:hypothetical protein